MNLSLENVSFWAVLAIWATIVFTLAGLIARFVIRRPRHRTALLWCAMAASLLPFVADRLPSSDPAFGVTFQRPYATTFVPIPMQISSEPPTSVTAIAGPEYPPSNPLPIGQILVSLWLTGSSIGLLVLMIRVLRMNRFARSGAVNAPMVAGFPVARLLLPAEWPGDLTSDEAEAALAHERAHLRGWHVAGRVIAEAFRWAFWWLPSVHWCVTQYDRTLEELADAEAIRTVAPQSLANALLKIAATTCRPGLAAGATSNGKHLKVRLNQIMKRQSVGHSAISLVIGLIALAAAVSASPRLRGLEPTGQDTSVKSIYGLAKGATWTYELKDGKQSEEVTQRVNQVISEKGMTVFELVTKGKGYSNYSYRGLRGLDLYSVLNSQRSGPGYVLQNPEPLLIRPFSQGNSWKWVAQFRGQTRTRPDGTAPDTSELDEQCTATIEAEEDIQVKAGLFHCFRVGINRASQANGTRREQVWISPDAGLVMLKAPAGQAASWELTKFTPASPL